MRITTWVSSVLLAASLAACGGKLSKDQCQKIVDHAVDLAVKQMGSAASPDMTKTVKDAMGSQMADMLDKCQKDGKQAEYDCAMKANTMDEMMKCDE